MLAILFGSLQKVSYIIYIGLTNPSSAYGDCMAVDSLTTGNPDQPGLKSM